MSTPINANVSMAFDPVTYQSVDGYNDRTRGYVDDVVSVFNDCYVTIGKLHEARKLAASNPAWTDAQKVLVVGKEAANQKHRLAQKLDRAMRDLDGRIEHVRAELARPVEQGAAAGPLAAEVRAHFKSVAPAERSKLIKQALEADDEPTLQAVLGAQPFLSGLTPVDREHFSGLYHAKKSPHLVERLELMMRVRDLVDKNGAHGPAFHAAFEKVVGAPPSEVNAIEKANRLAEEALKIEPTV